MKSNIWSYLVIFYEIVLLKDRRVVQWMTTSDTMSNNQWLLITTSGTINKNEWKRIRPSKKAWFWFQNETKWVMYNYNIYSAI